MKRFVTLGVLLFVICCLGMAAWLVSSPQLPEKPLIPLQQTMEEDIPVTTNTPTSTPPQPAAISAAAPMQSFGATGGPLETVVLGSRDENSDYLFELELTSKGAAVSQATFSRFDNRDPNNPLPQVFLSPVAISETKSIRSLSNQGLVLVNAKQKLRLDSLSWKLLTNEISNDGVQTASFQATITTDNEVPLLRLTKTYTVRPESYLFDYNISVENLGAEPTPFYMQMTGPVGPGQEGFRQDLRKTFAAYRDSNFQIQAVALEQAKLKKAIDKGKGIQDRQLSPEQTNSQFLWTAVANKYFAAIMVPQPHEEGKAVTWLNVPVGEYLPASPYIEGTKDTIGLSLQTQKLDLAAGASQDYNFQVYLGPKDKSSFDKDDMYKDLGFAYVIDFMGCCCPTALIRPLAFMIMSVMKIMYAVIPNYGIVIIILVFLMRLAMHPVTKKSQVSMHKMSQLAPRAEEIKKKYGNNKAELNKHLMELYREQGASPIMGFLPMMIQMPVWIALWSAVNSSIFLRGAAFLPFWITDLSVPDHLFSFGFNVPLLGSYFNLLPILMGVAFYMQQKLMPTQANAAANPQMAQQQKMMMIMMPLMFPVMMYSVPSGVNLYIMTSTFAGVLEQHIIRKHIKEKEAKDSVSYVSATSKTGGKAKKKKPKPMFKNFK